MLYSIFSVLVISLVAGAEPDTRKWSNLSGRKEFGLNLNELRNHPIKAEHAHEDPFPHSDELMQALRTGLKSFTVEVSVQDKPTADMEFEDIIQLRDFNITAEYHLHSDVSYHSLDDAHTLSVVKDLTDHHLIHCGENSKSMLAGDLIVGTSHAAWRQRPFSVKTKFQVGLVYTRRVVSQSPYQDLEHPTRKADGAHQTCFKTITEEIHPFELFDSFRMQTVTHVPFTYDDFDLNDKTTYQEAPQSTRSESYKQVHKVSPESLPVDGPAQTCSSVNDQYFGGNGGTFHDGYNDDYAMVAGYTVGCVSANRAFPGLTGFNFNYNPYTNAASSNLNLAASGITGLSCDNCFVYTGAYLMVVLNYNGCTLWGCYMALEAKVSGGLGFNVAAQMTNPAFSGSISKTLLSAKPNQMISLPIGLGMSVSTSFGGLIAVLSGSGSATGSATFEVGANANAYLGVGYHYLSSGTGWTWPAGVNYNFMYPTATYSSFAANGVNINVELVATQNFYVGYTWWGYNYLTADFSLALTGSANYAYAPYGSANPSITLSASPTSTQASARHSLSQLDDVLELSPGDKVAITVLYENFRPGERTELFLSAHRDDDSSETGTSILQVPFTVNGAGSGSVDVEWVVPWNSKFMQISKTESVDYRALLHSLSVHASNQMTERFFAPQKLKLNADPFEHGMVSSPAPNEIVAVNTSYVVMWDRDGLITFTRSVAGTSGLGALEMVPFVNIELHYEDVDPTGETALAAHVRLNTAPEPNDRSAQVIFPPAALDGVTTGCIRRFFVVVASAKLLNLMGWSKGYFSLVLPGAADVTAKAALSTAANSLSGLHKASNQFRRPAGAPKAVEPQLVRAVPLSSTPTPLSSCSSRSQVTFGSTLEGAFESVTFVYIPFPVYGLDAEYTLLQTGYCVNQPTAVVLDDTPSDSSNSKHGLSTAWVIGISVGSTVLLLLVSAWLYMRFYKRGSVEQKSDVAPGLGQESSTDLPVLPVTDATANPMSVSEV